MAKSTDGDTSEKIPDRSLAQDEKLMKTLKFLFVDGGLEEKGLENADDGVLVIAIKEKCAPKSNKNKNWEHLSSSSIKEIIQKPLNKENQFWQMFTVTGEGDAMRIKYTPKAQLPQAEVASPHKEQAPAKDMSAEQLGDRGTTPVLGSLQSSGGGTTSSPVSQPSEPAEDDSLDVGSKSNKSKKNKNKGRSTSSAASLPSEPAEDGWSDVGSKSNKSKKNKNKERSTSSEVSQQTETANEQLFDVSPESKKYPIKQDEGGSMLGAVSQQSIRKPKEEHYDDKHDSLPDTSGAGVQPDVQDNVDSVSIAKIFKLLNYIFLKEGIEERNLKRTDEGVLVNDIIEEFSKDNPKKKKKWTIDAFRNAFNVEEKKPVQDREPFTRTGEGDTMRVKHTTREQSPQAEDAAPHNKEATPNNISAKQGGKEGPCRQQSETAKDDRSVRKFESKKHKKHKSTDIEEAIFKRPKCEHWDEKVDTSKPSIMSRAGRHTEIKSKVDSSPRSGAKHSMEYSRGREGNYERHEWTQERRGWHQEKQNAQHYRGHGHQERGSWRDQQDNRGHSGQQNNEDGHAGYHNRRQENPDVRLSKSLSNVLRHRAKDLGFNLLPGGFIDVDELLSHKFFNNNTLEDIRRVVESNDKQRFNLVEYEKGFKIRANQGHTMEVDVEMREIQDACEFPDVIHGTYFQAWEVIKKTGLSRMGRNHIHCAPGEPGESGVISGMRGSCELIIYINMEKAMADGIQFFESANHVILTKGNKDGILDKKYFKAAVQRYPRMMIQL